MTKDETSKYSDLGLDGRSKLFTFPMEVKSVITSPSGGQKMKGPGLYQVSGLAWSEFGKIRRVDVSADGGRVGPGRAQRACCQQRNCASGCRGAGAVPRAR